MKLKSAVDFKLVWLARGHRAESGCGSSGMSIHLISLDPCMSKDTDGAKSKLG